MTEQEKREKVIKGLEHCIDDECSGDKWDKCEYSGHGCIDALLADALALLKAQEAHIVTIADEGEGKVGRIDKEKVLHGLDSCGFHDGIPNICEVTECPYRDNKAYCVHELAHDAGMLISELLKVQEPGSRPWVAR